MTPAFSIEAEEALLGALMLDPDAAGQIECDLQAGHFYREDHRRIYTAIRLLLDGKKAADPASLYDALEAAGDPPEVMTRALEVAAAVYSTAGTKRHAEIIVERSMLRNLQATADKIMCLADDMAGTVQEKIDTAQKLVMELSDRASLADREPKRVRDLLGTYLEMVGKRWEKSGGAFDTGFPDLDKRLNGGLAPGALIILAARPGMGKAQPLDSKILMADGNWTRMGDITMGDSIASVDGAESRVIGIFPQGVKQVFRVSFSDGRSAVACKEHLWRVMYRDWAEPRVLDTGKLIEMLGKQRYKNRLSIDVVSGDFGGGALPLDPYVLGVLLGDGGISSGYVRFSTADEEIVSEVRRRLGSASEVRKIHGKYDYSISSKSAEGRTYRDGCRLRYGHRFPKQLNHNNPQMHRPKIVYPVREALVALKLWGLGSSEKFIPEGYFSASRDDRLELLRGLMDTDGWAEAHASVRFSSSSKVLAEGVQRLVRSLGGLCSITQKRPTFTSKGEKRAGLVAWVCRIRHEHAEEFFRLQRKAMRAVRGKNASVRLNVASIEECGEVETQCIQVSHPSRLYVTDEYTVTHNTALALQLAEHFAEKERPALVLSQEMQSVQLIDRTVAFVGRVDLSKILTGEGMTDDDHERFAAAVARLENLPLVLDEQGSLRIEDVRRKARRTKAQHGLGLVVIDYLQLMVGNGENRTREITEITGALKGLAKELDVPILALSQLNRGVEQRPNKRPVMSDLRESGSIEQDADVIMALYRDEYYDPDSMDKGLAELLILKNRQGKTGGFVPLTYHGPYTRFDSMFGDWPERKAEERAPSGRGRKSGAFSEKA